MSTHTLIQLLTKATLSLAALTQFSHGQGDSLKTDLVSYWPFDEVQGNKTPDLASQHDFLLENLTASDLIPGKFGMGFSLKGANSTYLYRTHDSGDDLPAMKNDSFTIAYWVRANASGQGDLRIFCEASVTAGDGTPLFTMGTVPGGSNNSLDVYIRDKNGFPVFNHTPTGATPLDGVDWHHIAFVQTLQGDGSATREVYVDGVLDTIAIPAKAAGYTHNMNTTAFGAVVRAGVVAHVTGDIDEAAIWKRALTPAEITDLMTNGMPDLDETVEDLAINGFSAEYRKVIAGDQVKLSWDATKDATLSIDQGVGDVTAISAFGVGNTLVTITEPTTFTLTAERGAEAPITQTVSVSIIEGVTEGWNWIEDFNEYPNGALDDQGSWTSPSGSFEVVNVGDTQALATTAGNDLTGRKLGSHTVASESSRTLFFRFCLSSLEPDLPFIVKTGLTEKKFRFVDDWNSNIGTYITLSREAGLGLKMEAVNGIGGAPTDSGLTFEPDTSYDVWIDVQNVPLGETDTFSVHVAPTGGTRQTVFDNFSSDREPQEIFLLGVPRAPIDSLFLVTSLAVDQASQAIAFDDFYVSDADTLLGSIPAPSGFGKATLGPPQITDLSFDPLTSEVTLSWNSRPNTNYDVFASLELTEDGWIELEDGIPAEGTTTTRSFMLPDGTEKLFLQVRERQVPAD
ncbi:MAG: LamG domain-containing protein [Verrucomicrobiaceae bacterium]